MYCRSSTIGQQVFVSAAGIAGSYRRAGGRARDNTDQPVLGSAGRGRMETSDDIKRHFDTVAADLRIEIRAVDEKVDRKSEELKTHFSVEIRAVDEKVDRKSEELKTHFSVEIRAVDEKVDRKSEELQRQIRAVDEKVDRSQRTSNDRSVRLTRRSTESRRAPTTFQRRRGESEVGDSHGRRGRRLDERQARSDRDGDVGTVRRARDDDPPLFRRAREAHVLVRLSRPPLRGPSSWPSSGAAPAS